jgi:curved DNA-binding protein
MPDMDYYKLLGVEKTASKEQIKKAYRKLAMKCHPDHCADDPKAEEEFKQISEAYAVLKDDEKRRQYDSFGSADFQQRYSQEDILRGFDMGDIFREFGFGGRGGGPGGNVRFSFGGGGSPFSNRRPRAAKGDDLVYEIPLTLAEVAAGATKDVSFRVEQNAETLSVKIPKGMIPGKKLRLTGKGGPGINGGLRGDLYIRTSLLKDPVFSADEYDLYVNKTVKLTDAILGAKVSAPTIEGNELTLKIPAGAKHGTKLRIPGRGLPALENGSKPVKTGDMYVRLNVDIPKTLTAGQKKLIRSLQKEGL